MTDRPILFSAPMVRALLYGRKTQTRRIAKFIKPNGDYWDIDGVGGGLICGNDCAVRAEGLDYAPYCKGDRLWVRETFCDLSAFMDAPLFSGRENPIAYRADGEFIGCHAWKPSIFMPRAASRITLTVTDVRIQRLHECSETDAEAEGISFGVYDVEEGDDAEMVEGWSSDHAHAFRHGVGETARAGYAALWNTINGASAWDENPWVVAVSFDVRKGNIDR